VKQTERAVHIAPWVWIAIFTAVGAGLRLLYLGRWSLEGDEIFTYRDSIVPPRLSNARPLIYFLNYYLIRPFTPINELSLRLLPALFGILAIPVSFFIVRRLLNQRAGLFAALLVTFSSLHVYHSQSARYWSLVFLLSLIYPAAIFIGLREQNRNWLIGGIVFGILAILAHPTAAILLGGLLLWATVPHLRPDRVREAWRQRGVRWGALGLALSVLVIVFVFTPVLREWMRMPHQARLKGGALILSFVDGVTSGLALIALVGLVWLWRTGERSLSALLLCMIVVTVGFNLGLSYITAVSTAYLLPAAPAFFIAGAAFLDRFAATDRFLTPHGLLTAAIAALVISDNVPVLLSNYLDGSRADFRSGAQYVKAHMQAGDVVFSDQYPVLQHYLPGVDVLPMTRNPASLARYLSEAQQKVPTASLWSVALVAPRGGFRTHSLPRVSSWIFANCQLAATFGIPRLDFRQNELQVYRCPPEPGDFSRPSAVSNSR
jgi:predicted small integral membrane protein